MQRSYQVSFAHAANVQRKSGSARHCVAERGNICRDVRGAFMWVLTKNTN